MTLVPRPLFSRGERRGEEAGIEAFHSRSLHDQVGETETDAEIPGFASLFFPLFFGGDAGLIVPVQASFVGSAVAIALAQRGRPVVALSGGLDALPGWDRCYDAVGAGRAATSISL